MKYILSLIISGALVVSGFGQTRNVLVGTNNAVVQPTNFWSADASNARTGLGLGTAATSSVSAFQPASTALSNLATGNGGALSNLQATNLVGIIPASNISTVTFTNIGGTLAISSGGTGATNAVNARQNLGSTVVGDAVFIATNAAAARTAIGALATDGNAINLTNFPTLLLRTNGSGAGLTNITAANISGSVAIANGGTGATNAAIARTNLELGWSALTNTNASTSLLGVNSNGQVVYALTNPITFTNLVRFGTAANTNTGSFASYIDGIGYFHNGSNVWWVSTNNMEFSQPNAVRDNLNIGTNSVVRFGEVSTTNLLGGAFMLSADSGGTIYEQTNFSFFTPSTIYFIGAVGPNATNWTAPVARTNIGLPWSGLTNTNAATFQTALFGSNTNPVLVNTNGEVVSPTNFWAVAPISTTVQYQTNVTGTSTNAATNSRNLFLFSLSPSVSGITNTVTLPTNPATTFEGDRATITHLAQTTNAVTAIRQLGAATNLITLNQLDETVLLMYRSGAWMLADNLSYIEPIFFSGTNAAANAAASRTNLELGNISMVSNGVVVATNFYATNGEASFTNLQTRYLEFGDYLFVADTTNTNVIVFEDPTDRTNFIRGLGLGPTNSVIFANATIDNDTFIDGSGIRWGGGDRIQLEEMKLRGGGWEVENGAFNVVGETNKAITRTNLGLGLPAFTNTNNANFQAAVFATNAAPTNSANVNGIGFNTAVAWMEVTVSTNGTNHSFRIPLFR